MRVSDAICSACVHLRAKGCVLYRVRFSLLEKKSGQLKFGVMNMTLICLGLAAVSALEAVLTPGEFGVEPVQASRWEMHLKRQGSAR